MDASASRPRAATATTQRRRQSPRTVGGVGGLGFRFRETPARFRRSASRGRAISPRRARSPPDAARSVRPSGCNRDPRFHSIRPRGSARAALARGARARLPSPRARFAARRACRAFSSIARCGQTIPASVLANEDGAQTCFQSSRQLCSVSANARRRARFGGLRQSIPARLFVEPLGFQSMPSQTRGVFDRVIRETIRLPLEALEFGDVGGERGLRRSLGRPDYRSAQRPPRRLAARSAPPRCGPPSPEDGQPQAGQAARSFRRSPSPPLPALLRLSRDRTRSRLERVGELSKILGARHGQPGERFEVDDRRIEPRGGVCELERVLCQRDPIVSNPARQLGDLAESGIFFSQRRRDQGPRPAPLARCARRRGTSALGRVERPSRLPTPPRRAPP